MMRTAFNKFDFFDLKSTKAKRRSLWMVVGGLIIALGILLGAMHHKSRATVQFTVLQKQQPAAILRELNDINAKLHLISQDKSSAKEQLALQSIDNNVSVLQRLISQSAKTTDIQTIMTELSSVKENINSQMNALKKMLASLNGGKQYLEARSLPFQVVAVDIIGGLPFVSVNDESHLFPLGLGDTLAGWQLVSADYDAGIAEFANKNNQYVKVNAQG